MSARDGENEERENSELHMQRMREREIERRVEAPK